MTQDELYVKYPHLFARRELDMSQTCMCWGIAVADAWLPLIDKMSDEISKIDSQIQYEQIKEKFGALRVYTYGINADTSDEVRAIINKYESLSLTVCEVCGAPGQLRTGGWLKVLCDEHSEGREVLRK